MHMCGSQMYGVICIGQLTPSQYSCMRYSFQSSTVRLSVILRPPPPPPPATPPFLGLSPEDVPCTVIGLMSYEYVVTTLGCIQGNADKHMG